MRVLVHTIFYKPDLIGVAKYTAELCEWLTEAGHDVSVVAPPPYYPQWRVSAAYRQGGYRHESVSGVEVTRCPIWLPKRPSGVSRVLYSLSFAISSVPGLLRSIAQPPDVILVIAPSLMNAFLALPLARIAGSKAWLHVQDFETDLAYDLKQLRRGRPVVQWVERMLLRRFDVVSSISHGMLRKARSKGVAEEKLNLLPNWFDPARIAPLPGPSPLRAQLGLAEDSIVALFSGSLGAKQGVETILDAAHLLSGHPHVRFVICGDGIALQEIRAKASPVDNIRFLSLQPEEMLNDLLNVADVHLLPQSADAAGSVMPSKLIGMLATGRPIIATARSGTDIAELLVDCGIRVEPADSAGLASALRRLAENQEERRRLGKAARERALGLFRADVILPKFERDLKSLVNRRRGVANVAFE